MENIKNSDIFSYLIYRAEKAIGFLIFSINNKDYSDFCDINDYTKFYCTCNYWNRDSIEFYKNMGGIISKE